MKKRTGLFTKEEAKNVLKKPGVYFIYSDKRFSRLNGTTNIIYIGLAKVDLFKRLTTKNRKARPRFERLREHKHNLTFKIKKVCRTEKQAREFEARALLKFEEKHLELPPLNHSN